MDYVPLNILNRTADSSLEVDYFSTTIGEYDKLAIKYGYLELTGEITGKKHSMLFEIASMNQTDLPFATDEDQPRTDSDTAIDPYVNVYDLGEEPLEYYKDQLELIVNLQKKLVERVVSKDGSEAFTEVGGVETTLIAHLEYIATYAIKYLGGYKLSKERYVDGGMMPPNPPKQPISSTLQSDALSFVLSIITSPFPSDGHISIFPNSTTTKFLVEEGGWCEGVSVDCFRTQPINLQNTIQTLKPSLITQILDQERLSRVSEQSRLYAAQGSPSLYTFDDMISSMSTNLMDPIQNISSSQALVSWSFFCLILKILSNIVICVFFINN